MRRRTLNVKLLAILVGLGSLLGVGVCFVYQIQLRNTARMLIREADSAEAKGDYGRAALALEHYLAIRPRNHDALARYGLVLDRSATNPRTRLRAFLVLDQTIRLDPSRRDVRLRLVELAMSLGRFAEARTQLAILRKSSRQGPESVLEDLSGQCEDALGAFDVAASWYEKAIADAPHRREVYLRLAALLRTRLHAPERADRVLDTLVSANPNSSRVLLDRAAYRRRFHLSGAEEDLQLASKTAPEDLDVLLELARSSRDSDDLETARRLLERGLSLAPRDARFVEVLADVEIRAGRPNEAIAVLRRGLARLPGQDTLLWSLAELLARQGDTTELHDLIERLRAGGTAAGLLDFLDACLHQNSGDWAEAKNLFQRAQPALDSWPILRCRSEYLLGQCFGRLGDVHQQLSAFRRAATLDPNWVPARLAVASALTAQGKVDKAIEEYRAILPLTPEARPLLVRLLLQNNLNLPPDRRTWDEVERLIDVVTRDAPDAIETILLRADERVARDRLDDAQVLLKAARDRWPDRVELWLALIRLATRQEQWESALSLLDDSQLLLGDRALLRLERARIETAKGGPLAVKRVEALAQGIDQFSLDEQRVLLAGLASELFRLGSPASARQLWLTLADRDHGDLNVRLILLDLALEADDEAAMERLVKEFQRIQGEDGPYSLYAEARRLAWHAGRGDQAAFTKARGLLTTLAGILPEWPLVPLARAELDEIQSDRDGAIKAYLSAIDLGERSTQVIRRAASHLLIKRRYAEADRLFRLLPQSELFADSLLSLAADVAMQAADFPRALDLSRKAVLKHPDEYREYLRLGEALWAADRIAEAEAEYRVAVLRAPDIAQPWVALVNLLARTGQSEKVDSVIREIESLVQVERKVYIRSRCLDALGQLEQAQSLYQAILASRPDDFDVHRAMTDLLIRRGAFREAELNLRKINRRKDIALEDATWARRTLARVLTLEGGYPRVREALRLLDKPESSEDRLALVHVLVAMKSSVRTKEAIRILEQEAARERLTDGDRFLLGQLYETDGSRTKALECLRELSASQPMNTLYLTQIATLAMGHGRPDEAKYAADQLERFEPEAVRTVEIKARLLADQGRIDEAVTRIKAFAQGHDGELGKLAALLEDLGRLEEAEVLYRRAVEVSSGSPALLPSPNVMQVLELAEFFGRRDRTGEALDLCERVWDQGRPEPVTRACVNILAGAKGDGPDTRRVAQRLEEAVTRGEEAIPSSLLVGLAAIREFQGRYMDAEALYRSAITRNPQDPVPLNNLAWLMALKNGAGSAAIELINSAVDRFGPDPELLDTRAVVHLTNNRPDLACIDLNEAIALSPSATKYFHRARAHLRAGRRIQALSDLALMNKNMDRESRCQISQEVTFLATRNQTSPLEELRDLEMTQIGVKQRRR